MGWSPKKQTSVQEVSTANQGVSSRPALDVANYFIHRSGYSKTHLQIQKLTYMAHGYALAILDKPLFNDRVEAWYYGPVMPAVCEKFEDWENNPIGRVSGDISVEFDAREKKLLDTVFRNFGHFCGFYLVQLTHKDSKRETPWQQCYRKGERKVIPDVITKAYYAQVIAQ